MTHYQRPSYACFIIGAYSCCPFDTSCWCHPSYLDASISAQRRQVEQRICEPINCSHFINVLSVHHCSSGFVMASYGWRSSVSGLPGIRSILIDVLSKRNVRWMVQLPPSITPPSFFRLAWTNWDVGDAGKLAATRGSCNGEVHPRAWLCSSGKIFHFRLFLHMHVTRSGSRDAMGLAESTLTVNRNNSSRKIRWRKPAQNTLEHGFTALPEEHICW